MLLIAFLEHVQFCLKPSLFVKLKMNMFNLTQYLLLFLFVRQAFANHCFQVSLVMFGRDLSCMRRELITFRSLSLQNVALPLESLVSRCWGK
jgi:hypothetical protein